MVEVLVAAKAAAASTPAAVSATKTVSLALPIMNLLSTNGIHECLRVTETSSSHPGPPIAPGEPRVATLVPGSHRFRPTAPHRAWRWPSRAAGAASPTFCLESDSCAWIESNRRRAQPAVTGNSAERRKERRDRERQRERKPGNPKPYSKGISAQDEPGLVAESAGPASSPPALAPLRSDGRGLHLCRRVQDPRSRRAQARPHRGDDDVAGLVAGRLRPLRAALHPDVVACGGHVPHRRRPGRWRQWRSALRAAQQLARQREPRQGAPVALADQAEVRPEDLLG